MDVRPVPLGGRLSFSLLFRTSGPAPEVAIQSNSIGRTALAEKLRAGVDAKDPKIAHFLKLRAESAVLSGGALRRCEVGDPSSFARGGAA